MAAEDEPEPVDCTWKLKLALLVRVAVAENPPLTVAVPAVLGATGSAVFMAAQSVMPLVTW